MNIKRIFLDVDGVLADFASAAVRACGFPNLVPSHWHFYEDMDLTADEMWDRIHADPLFWENLPEYDWYEELVDMCLEASGGNVTIVTHPADHPDSWAGKHLWLKERAWTHEDVVMTSQKHLLGGPGRVLIDDSEENVQKWSDAGGIGWLFPQPWNSMRMHSDYPTTLVRFALSSWKTPTFTTTNTSACRHK